MMSADKITSHETLATVRPVKPSPRNKEVLIVVVDASCQGMQGEERRTLKLSPDG